MVIRITQITDLHLAPQPDFELGGVNTLASFKSVLRHLATQGRDDDLVLLTGDLANDGQAAAYHQLNQLLKQHNKQVIWLPGNHDNVALMQENLTDYPAQSAVEIGNWGIITLDSSQPNNPGGHIGPRQLQQVKENLEQLAEQFVLIALHHSPLLINSAWLDKQQIANQQQLLDLLLAHGKVKMVVTGHVHQHFEGDWGGLPLCSTPSSSVQFKPHSDDFAYSDQPPGYRWLDLYADGRIKTGVEYVSAIEPKFRS